MSLSPGSRVGPYEVTTAIGAGGMGEVFRARDVRLKRDVALKVLPASSVGNPDSRARFEREAQVLASLNHPSIAQVYGVENDGNSPVIAMEFVDGPTLADRIAKGALPFEEAIVLARQICDGLEAAHERGIVHRDLKPANIKVRPDGTIKILDFGLARVLSDDQPAIDASNSPTMLGATRPTTAGVILGTAAYMSPEQARAKAVDKRADIWAFGAILYEMLTGAKAFNGESITDVLAHIVERDPDWTKLPAAGGGRLQELLRRCLQKNPKDRLRDIADARYELEAKDKAAVSGSAPTSSMIPVALAFAAGAAVVAAGVVIAPMLRAKPAPDTAIRSVITLPPDTTMALSRGSAVAISPDGKTIVFAGGSKGKVLLYLRHLDRFESQPIAGTDGAASPFFSPDGRWIGFFADEKLKRVALDGGAPVTVTDARTPRGEHWGETDSILMTPTNTSPVWRVSAGGGKSEQLTTLRTGELSHRWPHLLPDGKSVLFAIWNDSGWENSRLAAGHIGSQDHALIVESNGGYPQYVRDSGTQGFLVYAREEGILAVPFDESTLTLRGQAVPVVDNVYTNLSGGAHFDLAPSGTLAYVAGVANEADRELAWVTLDGKATTVAQIRGLGRNWKLSSDGTRVLRVNTFGQTRDAWIEDIAHRTTMRVIAGKPNEPIWDGILTPDGKWIIYGRGTPTPHLYRRSADGRDTEEKLPMRADREQIANDISPDGKTLAFVEFDPASGYDIWTMPISPPGPQTAFARTNFTESNPTFSPDGKWIAYQSNESGRFEVFIRSFPDLMQVYRVSIEGGIYPQWAPSGKELLFRSSVDSRMMAATIAAQPTMQIGRPRVLFDARGFENNYAVAPDGQRLLMMPVFTGETSARQINLVQNFLAELRQRVR